MYNSFQLARKYIQYYTTASNGKGHGIHSPFVFDLVTKVFNQKTNSKKTDEIENARQRFLSNGQTIEVKDFGAGSSVVKNNYRKISKIARVSLKSKKYAQLLARIAAYFSPQILIELGTSLGITTAYLASASPHGKVITCEGDPEIAALAEKNLASLGIENVTIVKGNFDETIPHLKSLYPNAQLVYIDGNHRKEPTLRYFNFFYDSSNDQQVMIFDDIHWSKEMEEAWKEIKSDPRVTLTIDLFFIGLVFFRKESKVKQHFIVRF